jgi:multidrug transporter EmrE-like cation transporter
MKTYLLILPVALLVTYSQLIVKWRVNSEVYATTGSFFQRLMQMLKDPIILSGYIAALFASFAWLYIVAKLPLTVAFPVYIGVTFAMVILGGWSLLGEELSGTKLIAVLLIFSGILLGVSSDA